MPVSQSTRSKVENLANAITERSEAEHPMLHPGWMVRKTSNPFADIEDGSSDGLFLVGKQARLYQEALQALEDDEAVEHLTRATLDEALFALVRDVAPARSGDPNRPAIRQRVRDFFSDLVVPLSHYEVAFSIENIKLDAIPITFGNVVFREFTQQLAQGWGFETKTGLFRERLLAIVGQPVGIVRVSGRSPSKAAERAQGHLDRALNTFRVCVDSSTRTRILDRQLVQRRGEFRVIREISPESRIISTGGASISEPMTLDFTGLLAESTNGFLERLTPLYDDTIKEGLRDALFRSIEWVGVSLTRENYDHRIVDLFTAMEAVLTTKDDGEKGEAIATRLMLLSMVLNKVFVDPQWVLALYELRSRVIHGAALGVSGENDVARLRILAERVLLGVIELDGTHGQFSRPIDLIRFLESEERIENARNWLEQREDEHSKSLAKYARERQRSDGVIK